MTEKQKNLYCTVPQFSQQYFLFYSNGKSAARVNSALMPNGVHSFSATDSFRFLPVDSHKPAYILHYPCCGFEHFWNKYKTLGEFSNKWLGNVDIATSIGPFHTDSRDVVATGDIELAKKFYTERALISDKNLIHPLIENGVLLCIDEPRKILTKS
jgi:hypothetical protein